MVATPAPGPVHIDQSVSSRRDYSPMIIESWRRSLAYVDTVRRFHTGELTEKDYLECPMDSMPPISSFNFDGKVYTLSALVRCFKKKTRLESKLAELFPFLNKPNPIANRLVQIIYTRSCNYLKFIQPPDPQECVYYDELCKKHFGPIDPFYGRTDLNKEQIEEFFRLRSQPGYSAKEEAAIELIRAAMVGHNTGMRYPPGDQLELPCPQSLEEVLAELVSSNRLGGLSQNRGKERISLTQIYREALAGGEYGLTQLKYVFSEQISDWINHHGIEDKTIKRKHGFHGDFELGH